jgi:alkanesulfonate monooxygenase SsuD/methylene tetrahydromethanopterin reductase-like flavin-dependent oxidoreductase (luciferase family)
MEFGLLCVPHGTAYVAGLASAKDVIDWDLQVARWADQHGLDAVFFAEHYTLGMEPSPAPDMMIAAASQLTSRIKLGAAAHLLPYHNPVALAHRLIWLDHMTGGRYVAGVAPGAYPSDAKLFGTGKNNPRMMIEALDIIEAIWNREGPFRIEGEFFSVDMPAYDEAISGPHLKSLQPRIPMIMTGMQAQSPTLIEAGRRGFLPMSQQVNESVLVQHWATYSEAAVAAGHTPNRADWHIARDVIVADTDAEARDLAINGALGEIWMNWNVKTFQKLGVLDLLTAGQIDPDDLSIEWLVDNYFIVGSPDTVAEKITALHDRVGGFGTLLSLSHEYTDRADEYEHSFELLGNIVSPRLRQTLPNLTPVPA